MSFVFFAVNTRNASAALRANAMASRSTEVAVCLAVPMNAHANKAAGWFICLAEPVAAHPAMFGFVVEFPYRHSISTVGPKAFYRTSRYCRTSPGMVFISLQTATCFDLSPDKPAVSALVQPDSGNGLMLADHAESVRLGHRTRSVIDNADTVKPAPVFALERGDRLFLSVEQSWLDWPTFFTMNFMTGNSPSWRRYRYYRLVL